LELFLQGRFARNQELPGLGDHDAEVPRQVVEALAREIAFETRVCGGRSALRLDEALLAVRRALTIPAAQFPGLDERSAIKILTHYEILNRLPDGSVAFEHDIVADWLAAPLVAERW